MASGDTVLQAEGLTVKKSVSGRLAGSTDGFQVALTGWMDPSHEYDFLLNELVVYNTTNPIDPAKTYDVIIKEH